MLTENKLRIAVDVVFDCNVYLRSVVAAGSLSAECLAFLGTQKVSIFVSRDILEEIKRVLSKSELQSKFRRLTQETTQALLGRLRQDAILIHNVPETFRFPVTLPTKCTSTWHLSLTHSILSLMTKTYWI